MADMTDSKNSAEKPNEVSLRLALQIFIAHHTFNYKNLLKTLMAMY